MANIWIMCGRYRRKSDKQRIAKAFQVRTSLDDLDFAPEDDITPGTMQPVVHVNDDGNREIQLMYWRFNFPKRFTFITRSESVLKTGLWKSSFEERRCIVPADTSSLKSTETGRSILHSLPHTLMPLECSGRLGTEHCASKNGMQLCSGRR